MDRAVCQHAPRRHVPTTTPNQLTLVWQQAQVEWGVLAIPRTLRFSSDGLVWRGCCVVVVAGCVRGLYQAPWNERE